MIRICCESCGRVYHIDLIGADEANYCPVCGEEREEVLDANA